MAAATFAADASSVACSLPSGTGVLEELSVAISL
jgi:hypothetical protein